MGTRTCQNFQTRGLYFYLLSLLKIVRIINKPRCILLLNKTISIVKRHTPRFRSFSQNHIFQEKTIHIQSKYFKCWQTLLIFIIFLPPKLSQSNKNCTFFKSLKRMETCWKPVKKHLQWTKYCVTYNNRPIHKNKRKINSLWR